MIGKSLTLALLATVVVAGTAQARDQIRIVGSSTVYPFSTRVAEEFGRTTRFNTPVVESTLGKGTTVTVLLPAADRGVAAVAETAQSAGNQCASPAVTKL